MVPVTYPPQQKKAEDVLALSRRLAAQKAREEKAALQLADAAPSEGLRRLMAAAARSMRLVNEDLLRESGYMLPQSGNTHALLQSWADDPPGSGFPAEAVRRLLELLPNNEGSDA